MQLYETIVHDYLNYLRYCKEQKELSNLYLKNLDKYVNTTYMNQLCAYIKYTKVHIDEDLLHPISCKDCIFKTFIHVFALYKALSSVDTTQEIKIRKNQIEELLKNKNFINKLLKSRCYTNYIKYSTENKSYFNKINTAKISNFMLSPRGVLVVAGVVILGVMVLCNKKENIIPETKRFCTNKNCACRQR
jgi:hypothetical protein